MKKRSIHGEYVSILKRSSTQPSAVRWGHVIDISHVMFSLTDRIGCWSVRPSVIILPPNTRGLGTRFGTESVAAASSGSREPLCLLPSKDRTLGTGRQRDVLDRTACSMPIRSLRPVVGGIPSLLSPLTYLPHHSMVCPTITSL
jgi:hypothetical protein